jgi:hypothetical protein
LSRAKGNASFWTVTSSKTARKLRRSWKVSLSDPENRLTVFGFQQNDVGVFAEAGPGSVEIPVADVKLIGLQKVCFFVEHSV